MTKRVNERGERVDSPAEFETFLAEVLQLCERHGVWISHEDYQGAFILTRRSTREWLADAGIEEP